MLFFVCSFDDWQWWSVHHKSGLKRRNSVLDLCWLKSCRTSNSYKIIIFVRKGLMLTFQYMYNGPTDTSRKPGIRLLTTTISFHPELKKQVIVCSLTTPILKSQISTIHRGKHFPKILADTEPQSIFLQCPFSQILKCLVRIGSHSPARSSIAPRPG